jgi:hypothetical protein
MSSAHPDNLFLQGHNARPANIAIVLEAFRDGLKKQGKL